MSLYVVKEEIRKTFAKLMDMEQVRKGLAYIEADQPRCIEEQKVMVTIESPTFAEEKRAQYYAERLKELGMFISINTAMCWGRVRGKVRVPKSF